MLNYEDFEDFYIAIVKENPTPDVCAAKPGDYALFHAINGASNPIVGISQDYLAGYLAGALYRKDKKNITLINGVTDKGRGGWFPKVTFSSLSNVDLEKILRDARVDRIFGVADFR